MQNMPNFFDPQESKKIIEMYLNQFSQDIKELLNIDVEPSELSPSKIFWLNHLNQFHWLKSEVEELEDDDEFNNDIFEVLTDSEYSKDFLEKLDQHDKTFKQICLEVLDLYEKQLQYLELYHVKKQIDSIADDYRENLDLGDKNGVPGGLPVAIENSSLTYLSGNDENYPRIVNAIQKLQHLTPVCYDRLSQFTKFLIPITDPGMVSFSSEALPFHSCINFTNRDDIDLLDDLLHENGHHQLNFYLYCFDFIDEDDPNLYFSPWRESLRPLRGIFHGYCTFYWAYDLFKNLMSHSQIKDYFEQDQISKIEKRYLEERVMLEMAFAELEKAHENEYVSKLGMQVVKNLQSILEDDQQLYQAHKLNHKQHMDEFEAKLNSQRQQAYNQL